MKHLRHTPCVVTGILFILFATFKVHASGKNGRQDNSPVNSLLPVPQKIVMQNDFCDLTGQWTIISHGNVPSKLPVYLRKELQHEANLYLGVSTSQRSTPQQKRSINLIVKEGSVQTGPTVDRDASSIRDQAYRLLIKNEQIVIEANAPHGLFYGMQTLIQLLQSAAQQQRLQTGQIEDWPQMSMRLIYWDDSHHLDRFDELKKAIRQAARYKVNAFILKLEGHFEYATTPAIVEPYALTKGQHQELTDIARENFIQLIPYLDAPAHVSFILKHPEYKHLRAFPNSNYQLSVTHPGTTKLLQGMFGELLDASKGSDYVFLSTDEAYYVGKSQAEKEKAKELGGNGRLLAKFIADLSDYLHKKGRKIIIWGEAPLLPSDVRYLPSHLINGINENSKVFNDVFKKHGIRNFIFSSTQGVEPLFPEYYKLTDVAMSANSEKKVKSDDDMAQGDISRGRVAGIIRTIREAIGARKSDIAGIIVCGWADSGLHPETFWLGYLTGTSAGWNTDVDAAGLTDRFFRTFYGFNEKEMKRIYQLLSYQVQFWAGSWDWGNLHLRTPLFGYSAGIFDPPRPAEDQVLPSLIALTGEDGNFSYRWREPMEARLNAAHVFLKQNDELLGLLHHYIRKESDQRYNLRVLQSVAELCRNNINMLLGLQRIDSLMALTAEIIKSNPVVAVSLVDLTLGEAIKIRAERNVMFRNVVSTWYESWLPRVDSANGRKYVDEVDDVKDHLPVRTVDMSYLILRDLHYPMDKWFGQMIDFRNKVAARQNIALVHPKLNWTVYDDNVR